MEGRKKLLAGVQLMLLHPQVALRDCNHCQRFMYDEETGKVKIWGATGKPLPRAGRPPCAYKNRDGTTRCPKGTPTAGKTLTPQNLLAYHHYQECKAVFRFPNDPIVRRNARLIAMAERNAEHVMMKHQTEVDTLLRQLGRS